MIGQPYTNREQDYEPLARDAGAIEAIGARRPVVAVVHNHPIHYKELLFTQLVKLGIDLRVLYLGNSSIIRPGYRFMGGGKYTYTFASPRPYEHVSPRVQTVFVWRQLNRIRPDVVIYGGYCDAGVWAALAWARLRGTPGLIWAETNKQDNPRVWWKERLKRSFLARCNGAHVYGESCRSYFQELGMSRERITIKRAVVNLSIFPLVPRSWSDHQRVGIYVGRLAPEKNLERLLQAFITAHESSWGRALKLIVVGSGPLKDKLEQLLAKHRAKDLVEFAGEVPQEALSRQYGRADFFVLPSLREPYGLVTIEAMATGLPVAVSNRCGCVPDVVTPETGWCFDPIDPGSIQQTLRSVCATPSCKLAEMGARAHELALQYSPELCARRVAVSLARVLDIAQGAAQEAAI